ncbi:MAG TPA: ATP-binding protein [Polyangiaceae bacterium]|nr:ATP-binding protein [Polyangiaceae bacterium]
MPEDNQRLLQAIRVGNIGIFEHDHQADSIFWSPELRQMYGWDAEEPVTLSKIVAHVYPEDVGGVLALVQRAHDPAGDGKFDIEHRIVDRRGTVRWVQTRSQTHFGEIAGKICPIRTIGAVQDVTKRRIADERLRVLDAVLSSSAQAIAIADAHGALTFANAALRRLWGHDDEAALLGRSLFEFWRTEQEPAAALEQIRVERARTVELPAARVDGAPFYLEVTAEAVCDPDGALAQVLVTFTDITLRKRLESQLSHAQKMESIGRLAGGIAHDFNNMLTVILGGIELSLPRLDSAHPSRVYLRDAAEAAQSAAALTRQLLAFSRKEVIAPRALDVNEVIGRMQKMILRLLGEDVRLETVCGHDLPPISFDPVQIEQVILNLAVNARDAMTTGGKLTIETSAIRPSASELPGLSDGGVLLTVSDNGAGITDEVRAHLFEPFFTTKEPGKGTGLGLAMVYGAVQQNGGYIEVDSTLGHGSRFKILLPAATSPSVPAPVVRAQSVPAPTRRASILLVEDHSKVAAFARTVLVGLGHVVHAFPDAESALRALPTLSPKPDVLITDLVMPGLDGRTLAAHAVAKLPGLQVLFVSGYAHDVMAARGILAEGVELLAKPYSAEQLAARLRQLLQGPG